jgi:hypothetical protein
MKHAEITLPVSQIKLTVRRQPAGVLKSLRVRAEQINADTKPKPPAWTRSKRDFRVLENSG